MSVPAGMVGVLCFPAVIAMPSLAAELGRTAPNGIPHGFNMAGQDVGLMLVLVIGSVPADDVRQ
jgi:hypothetical protein